MRCDEDEVREQQALLTGLLFPHVQAPYARDMYLRGALPTPPASRTFRVVVGTRTARTPGRCVGYDIPLDDGGRLRNAQDVTGLLRALSTGLRFFSNDRTTDVLGMPVYRIDPDEENVRPPGPDDIALSLMRGIVFPWREPEPGDFRLLGFWFLGQDLLRLYCDSADTPGVIGADVRPSGATTAVVHALPALVREEERHLPPGEDPHCAALVDLRDW